MTRDAEHTPTGYEDAASVEVNQAPAPSSLAGGGVMADLAVLATCDDMVVSHRDGDTNVGDVARRCLAALSPEAPAREGVDIAWFRTMVEEKLKVATRADRADALFPMGPEEAALYHRTRADLLGWVLDMLPSDMPALTPRHEAPAEGAGEMPRCAKCGAGPLGNCGYYGCETPRNTCPLRARSSAPEAREGEVVGWRWRFDNDLSESMWFYGHVIPERPENAINTIVETQPLYTHPAAPSADKLRIGLDEIARLVNQSGAIPKGELRSILSALEAEGC